ncbi:hypothetical protein C7974DRAFT_323721 [Boeremia exigua]|uniref:uncharacterized protein n=1 Tax=Boeremia exigua TaxID=749465 RepID=UPI001E8D5A81|nr:uncharacterized protein C7974DRAFT_323721 [Boeremia exigua]KAH6611860.1 hypothetical protein C7974DRAFT_323721 [Boeremia exigua]
MSVPIGAKSPLEPHFEEKLPLRACDIAEDHFKKELVRHESAAGTASAGTIVIVHDQCYGHRFSRPKTPKNMLSLIMERPERILASVLGIATAYVRLGGRHAEGRHPLHPDHSPPERIPFAIRKTSRLVDITSPVVTNVHGTKWMEELKSLCVNAGTKLATTGRELTRDTPSAPGQPPKHEFHSGDLYLCEESLNAFQGALGGVLDAVDAVFQGSAQGNGPSRAFVCVRPPGHHCSADFPSGFCWLNNVHVGIEHAMMQYGLTHAAIIDFDLHHGDGSQAITWARNKKVQNMHKSTANRKKTSIGYFSLHDINSYPCEDGDDDKVQAASLCIDNAHGQSIWNVHLQSWRTPEEFWAIYEDKYLVLLDKTRQYLRFHTKRFKSGPNQPAPKAAIFLSAGFDASEWETAGMQRHAVNVPTEFYARFTRDVVRLAEEEGTSVDGRVISVLEGGYSDRALASGVMSHISGLTDGQVYHDSSPPSPSNGSAFDLDQRLDGLNLTNGHQPVQSAEANLTPITYDPSWWHASHLAELESLVQPPLPIALKKIKQGSLAHFSSPTQSFTAKVVDPTKLSHLQPVRGVNPSRPITPPPPDVDWATAAHALSALLVPLDRQTRSCMPEELAPPQIKKEKPVAAPSSAKPEPSGRKLRGRKPVASYADHGSDEDKASLRTESRTSRRQTIADFQPAPAEPPPATPSSRRMSVASSVSSVSDFSVSRGPGIPPGNSRRPSAAPSSVSTNNIPVTKGRGPNPAASSRAPQRPTVPRVPSAYTNKAASVKGKENDDMDSLTTGLKRVTLKMPSREEYEAREKEKAEKNKALEASKKTAGKKSRKAPGSRTVRGDDKPSGTKRASGRTSKASEMASSPSATPAPTMTPEPPQLQSAAATPLEQPEPIHPEPVASVAQQITPSVAPQESSPEGDPEASRRSSAGVIEPPTDLRDSVITPEQLREQLPLPAFVTATAVPKMTALHREETPPPPPPAPGMQFANYNSRSFDPAPPASNLPQASEPQTPAALHWLSQNAETTAAPLQTGSRPMSPARRQDLPVFTANSTIPFAAPGPAPVPQSAPIGIKADDHKDVWAVPDTPAH